MKKFLTAIIISCISLNLLAACGYEEVFLQSPEIEESAPAEAITPMQTEFSIDYDTPEQKSHLITANHYDKSARKRAYLYGRRLPEKVRVVSADDNMTSFTVDVINTGESDLGLTGRIIFDKLETTGEYYLECDYLGESEHFYVVDDLYQSLYNESTEKIMTEMSGNSISVYEMLSVLLSIDLYPEAFADANKDGIPDMLMQAAVWASKISRTDIGYSERAGYVTFFAKLGRLYQKYDSDYATNSVQTALTLFEESALPSISRGWNFAACAELYRATGKKELKEQTEEILNSLSGEEKFMSDSGFLQGALTYISTPRAVDAKLCGALTSRILSSAEQISANHMDYLDIYSGELKSFEELTKNFYVMVIANYILDSYEYYHVTADVFSYTDGCNRNHYLIEKENTMEFYFPMVVQIYRNNIS